MYFTVITPRIKNGTVSSVVAQSFENRVNIFPIKVLSKKVIVLFITDRNIALCIFIETLLANHK